MKTSLGKILSVAVIALVLTTTAHVANAQFFYGFKGGYLSSKLNGSDTYGGLNYHNAVSGGISFGFKFNTDFNFEWEILYSQKGVHQKFVHKDLISGTKNDTSLTFTTVTKQYDNYLKLSYVEVPMLFKKSFSFNGGIFPYDRQSSKWDFDIYAGPYVGYLFASSANLSTNRQATKDIGGDIEVGGTTDTIGSFFIGQNLSTAFPNNGGDSIASETLLSAITDERSINDLSKVDVGLMGGIGFSVEITPSSKLTIDYRYSIGLLTIDNGYFSDRQYVFTESPVADNGTTEIASRHFIIKPVDTKKMLTNSSMGIYIGYIHYLGMHL